MTAQAWNVEAVIFFLRFLSLVAIVHVICNNDDRRQRRIEGEVVGAAASRTRVHLHEANAGSRNPGSIKKSPFLPLGIRGAGNSSRNQPFPAPGYRQVGCRLRFGHSAFAAFAGG